MAGEMGYIHPTTGKEADGTVWSTHAAIVRALRRAGYTANIKPFDQYQGPYIAVGSDVRLGSGPYAMAPRLPGVVRLWLSEDEGFPVVYREDTDTMERAWNDREAGAAALSLLRDLPKTHKNPRRGTRRRNPIRNPKVSPLAWLAGGVVALYLLKPKEG